MDFIIINTSPPSKSSVQVLRPAPPLLLLSTPPFLLLPFPPPPHPSPPRWTTLTGALAPPAAQRLRARARPGTPSARGPTPPPSGGTWWALHLLLRPLFRLIIHPCLLHLHLPLPLAVGHPPHLQNQMWPKEWGDSA